MLLFKFIGALPVVTGAYGDDTVSSILSTVKCSGNETKIVDCFISTNASEACSHHSAAVVCQGLKHCIGLTL